MTTPTDYKRAAEMNLWAAKMMRRQGDDRSADNHLNMADFYIKQELRRMQTGRARNRETNGHLLSPRPGSAHACRRPFVEPSACEPKALPRDTADRCG